MTVTFNAGQRLTGAGLMAAIASVDRILQITKPADELGSVSSTTLADDLDLLVALAASTTYTFELQVIFTAVAAADIKLSLRFPSGAACAWGGIRMDSASAGLTGSGDFGTYTSATSGVSTIAAGGTGGAQTVGIMGRITTSTASGNLRLQWAQNTSNPTADTVHGGSWLRAIRS